MYVLTENGTVQEGKQLTADEAEAYKLFANRDT